MHNHLVPETRTNKNGVPVVKYVRPASATSAASVPPPTVASTAPKAVSGTDISNRIKAIKPSSVWLSVGIARLDELSDERRADLMSAVESFTHDEMRLLGRAVEDNDLPMIDMVASSYRFIVDGDTLASGSLNVSRAYLFLKKAFDSQRQGAEPEDEVMDEEQLSEVKGFYLGRLMGVDERTGIIEMIDHEDYAYELASSMDVLEKSLPALFAMRKLRQRPPSAQSLVELAELISEHPDRAEEVAGIITARNSADLEMLDEVLEHDVQALSDGVL